MKHTAARLAGSDRAFLPAASRRINPRWSGPKTKDLGKIMQNNMNFASLGAIGPDLFFFLPDFRNQHGVSVSSVLVEVLNFLENLYNTVDPFVTKWEQYLGPISEDAGEEMSRLTGGLSETVGDITGELSSILITALEDFVTEQRDWWSFFSLGLNQGFDDQAFFWSDMLHYRDTGQFAREIWAQAQAAKSDAAMAYALGYNTHLSTDVTGHAFVNSIAGGPFRLHWQRHHLVENHMDAHWYLNDSIGPRSGADYPQLTESALYFDIAFQDKTEAVVNRPAYPPGATMRENWDRSQLLDIDSEMPDDLANILLKSMLAVFYRRPNPDNTKNTHPEILNTAPVGLPTADMIKEAYDLFFRYLKLVTVDGFSHEPPDPPDWFPNLNFPTPVQPANDDAPGGGSSGDGNFWDDLLDFILSVINILEYIAEVAAYLATLPWAVIADTVTYPLRLGLYYSLELPLFHLLQSFRAVLVMTGYMLPMDDEIAQFLTQIGNTDSGTFNEVLILDGDVFGGLLPPPEPPLENGTYRDPAFPHSILRDSSNNPSEFRAPWSYPDSPVELHDTAVQNEPSPAGPLLTTAGPHPAGATPDILFAGVTSDPGIRDRFEAAATPGDADVIGQDVTPMNHLGDAVGFSEYFIWLESRDPVQADGTQVPLVEWNLDSDCGYGYHCWDWNRNNKATWTDPEGSMFNQPCTWPSQANNMDPPATPAALTTRLKLHWVGPGLPPDPGCGVPPPGRRIMRREVSGTVKAGKRGVARRTAARRKTP